MVGQVLVELRGGLPDLGEVVPGAGGEIVVLNMVSQVQVEEIPEPKVVISLLSLHNFVVLGDCMSCGGVGPDGDEGHDDEVQDGVSSPVLVD